MRTKFSLFIAAYFALVLPAMSEWQSLEEYYEKLQTGCRVDTDCVEKNVGNCCGGYPKCVTMNATPDLAWVSKFCKEQGMAGICGYPKIAGCSCSQNRCQDMIESSGRGVEQPEIIY